MDPTAIQAGTSPQARPLDAGAFRAGSPRVEPAAPADDAGAPRSRRQPKSAAYRALEAVASLRITVVLFVFALVLVFYGTLAQVDNGIQTVVTHYFRSVLAWIPVRVLLFNLPDVQSGVGKLLVPYPGGRLLGGLLLVNLLAAHAVRFKFTWRRSGILILHAGLIVMMLSELFTSVWAVEARMPIEVGHATNYVELHDRTELAFRRVIDAKKDEEVAIPAGLLKPGKVLDDERLPAIVEVLEYMPNSTVDSIPNNAQNKATAGIGLAVEASLRNEASGVGGNERDLPSAYVTLRDRGTKQVIGTYLVSTWASLGVAGLDPDWVTIDGKRWLLSLRDQRSYRPYTFALERFDFKKFPGTDMARDYRSFIHLTNAQTGEDRRLEIYMNAPLRYDGETFYQSGVLQDNAGKIKGTILQVVDNPTWTLPYVSCVMVSCGMLIHFGIMLVGFVRKQLMLAGGNA